MIDSASGLLVGARLTASDEVLLACLRNEVHDHPDIERVISEIADGEYIDRWDGQGVLPLAVRRLVERDLMGRFPEDHSRRMLAICEDYRQIWGVYREATLEMLDALERAGVPAMMVKDLRAYPHPHTRPSYDVDLIVEREHVEVASQALWALGYTGSADGYRSRLVDKVRAFDKYIGEIRVDVDLHWNILGGYLDRARRVDVTALFERSVAGEVDGAEVRLLAPEDHLVNLCMHHYQHECRWPTRLLTLCDIAETLRSLHGDLNWEVVVERTREWDAGADVYHALVSVAAVLGSQVPADVLAKIRPTVMRLGVDASLFGYLNYTWKFAEHATRALATRDADEYLAKSDAALPAAQWANEHATRLADYLALWSGAPVTTFGEPGSIVPVASPGQFGNIDVVLDRPARTENQLDLIHLGYQQLSETEFELSDARSSAKLLVEVLHVVPQVMLDPAMSAIGNLLRSAKRVGPREIRVRVLVLSAEQRITYLRERVRGSGALDLSGLLDYLSRSQALSPDDHPSTGPVSAEAELLDRMVALATGPEMPLPRSRLSLLEALDRRTAGLEMLTKILWLDEGVQTGHVAGARGAGAAAWVRALRASAVHPVGAWRIARMLATSRASTRVPARAWVTREGHDLVDGRQLGSRAAIHSDNDVR